MLPHINVTIAAEDAKPKIGELVKEFRPKWRTDELQYRIFDEGLTNALYGVYNDNQDDMILFRIFGENSEMYVNREKEKKTIEVLSSAGLAARQYATFNNGYIYAYIPGRLLVNKDVRVPEIADLIAAEIGKLHAVLVPADYAPSQSRGSFFTDFEKMVKMLPEKLTNPTDDERYQTHVKCFDLLKEMNDIEKMVSEFNEEMVICHHDLTEANIIIANDEKSVRFIDYEYAGLDYGSIDIAVHFIVYINILDPDPVRYPYPTRDQQMRFLTRYLEVRYPHQPVTDQVLHTWYRRVNKMAAWAYLYWGVWCVLNGVTSNIDFDFIGLGIVELNEYKKMKDRVMAL